jgi:hypothetical protein
VSNVDLTLLERMGRKLDSSGGPPEDGDMLKRIEKLEADLVTMKTDIAVIKANGSTKSDIAELRASTKSDIAELKVSIAESQTKIIMWVVVAVFLAQLLPLIKDFLKP